MNPKEANTLLDMARAGLAVPTEVISWALTVTGDLLQSNWAAKEEIEVFVEAMRREGLL